MAPTDPLVHDISPCHTYLTSHRLSSAMARRIGRPGKLATPEQLGDLNRDIKAPRMPPPTSSDVLTHEGTVDCLVLLCDNATCRFIGGFIRSVVCPADRGNGRFPGGIRKRSSRETADGVSSNLPDHKWAEPWNCRAPAPTAERARFRFTANLCPVANHPALARILRPLTRWR